MSAQVIAMASRRPAHPDLLIFCEFMDRVEAVSYGLRLVRGEMRRHEVDYTKVARDLYGVASAAIDAADMLGGDGGGEAA